MLDIIATFCICGNFWNQNHNWYRPKKSKTMLDITAAFWEKKTTFGGGGGDGGGVLEPLWKLFWSKSHLIIAQNRRNMATKVTESKGCKQFQQGLHLGRLHLGIPGTLFSQNAPIISSIFYNFFGRYPLWFWSKKVSHTPPSPESLFFSRNPSINLSIF